jgi:hypothetical protein
MNQLDQLSIQESIEAGFALARAAAMLREAIGKQLPNLTGRDNSWGRKMCMSLDEIVVAFGHLEDSMAAFKAGIIGKG